MEKYDLTPDERGDFDAWRRRFLWRGKACLFWRAANEGRTVFVKHLAGEGYGADGLYTCVAENNLPALRALIEAGFSANDRVPWKLGESSLLSAAALGRTEAAQTLIGAGANPDLQDVTGLTALMAAAMRGYDDIVDALTGAGANPFLCDKRNRTARDWAANHGHPRTAAKLEAYEREYRKAHPETAAPSTRLRPPASRIP